jgi:hypothetical protein
MYQLLSFANVVFYSECAHGDRRYLAWMDSSKVLDRDHQSSHDLYALPKLLHAVPDRPQP